MGDLETGDVATDWSLSFEDLTRIEDKASRARLGFGALLRFRWLKGRFPRDKAEISAAAITHLAEQIGVNPAEFDRYDLTSRSSRRHRVEILDLLGMRRMTRADRERYLAWLETELCPQGLADGPMLECAALWFNEQRIACPEHDDLELLIETSRRRFEHRLLEAVAVSLSPQQKVMLDASLADEDAATGFNGLKADPGRVGLESVFLAAKRLRAVARSSEAAMPGPNSPISKAFRRRVTSENAWGMSQHPAERRHALYAIFLAHATGDHRRIGRVADPDRAQDRGTCRAQGRP